MKLLMEIIGGEAAYCCVALYGRKTCSPVRKGRGEIGNLYGPAPVGATQLVGHKARLPCCQGDPARLVAIAGLGSAVPGRWPQSPSLKRVQAVLGGSLCPVGARALKPVVPGHQYMPPGNQLFQYHG